MSSPKPDRIETSQKGEQERQGDDHHPIAQKNVDQPYTGDAAFVRRLTGEPVSR